MAYKVILFERAERDILEAFGYIYEHAPDAAVRWYQRLKVDIQSLSETPARCSKAPESRMLGFELRQLIFGKRSGRYRIIFRILEESKEVHVLAIRHGARKPLDASDL
jgi:plasmid stabilization system protein ParE